MYKLLQSVFAVAFTIVYYASTAQDKGWITPASATDSVKLNGEVSRLLKAKNGNLLVTGNFQKGSRRYVGVWNDTSFTELDAATTTLQGHSIITGMCQDTAGNVYAACNINGVDRWGVSKWNGVSWQLLDTATLKAYYMIYDICSDTKGNIYASCMHSVPSATRFIAMWNGQSWKEIDTVGHFLQGSAATLIKGPDSTTIYAAGNFMNTASNYYVAKWDGNAWTQLGNGGNALNANDEISALYMDKQNNVYAGGLFKNSNNQRYVAKWDGQHWSELGTGSNGLNANNEIKAIYCDTMNNVYAAGKFTNSQNNTYVAKWNGTSWAELGAGNFGLNATAPINTIAQAKSTIYAGGQIFTLRLQYIAEYSENIRLSIDDVQEGLEDITVYPNPANSQVRIRARMKLDAATVHVSLLNSCGQLVIEKTLAAARAVDELINISQMPAGTYFMELSSSQSKVACKLEIIK